MDLERELPIRGGIPRLSKLPTPRASASNDNLRSIQSAPSREDLRQENFSRIPALPRPSGNHKSRALAPPPSPLGESINKSIRSRFGWPQSTAQNHQSRSPVRDALTMNDEATLDTTPPRASADLHVHDTAHENAMASECAIIDENATSKIDVITEKRRPRPSLSERTVETLSQVSPSPSPSRRRSSFFSSDESMGPPSRPASSRRSSRPNTALSLRPTSPTKRNVRPSGASSPTKDTPPMPQITMPSSIYTPPKAFMRDRTLRVTKPLRETRRSVSTAVTGSHHQASHNNCAAASAGSQTVRVKPTHSTKSILERSVTPKASLSTMFKDQPNLGSSSSKLGILNLDKKPGLLKPRSFGENTLAPSASSSPPSAYSMSPSKPGKSSSLEVDAEVAHSKNAKSSAALRETIAKAKAEAAKKPASIKSAKSTKSTDGPTDGMEVNLGMDESLSVGSNRGRLFKRIQGATGTGNLNIAAMNLDQIPDEVMKMYDSDSAITKNWAEMVDLVKFVAADNKLTELRPDAFPDWSAEEMVEDDTKTNQFGGLEILDLHSNKLQAIPIGLRRLERLRTLNLSNNQLSAEAMGTISQMKSLRELYLSNNQLAGVLTVNIGQLVNLQVLDLSGNNLEELPTSLAQLKNLRTLKVSGNKLSGLPFESLVGLPLVEIQASKNKLAGSLFPEIVEEMATLRNLDVSFNLLDRLSQREAVSLPVLQSLSADANRLLTLGNVSSWRSLTTLTASENLLDELPAGFADLLNLRNADFSRNNIKLVPEVIALMDNLSSLNLASNPLRDRKYLTMSTDDLKDNLRKRLAPADTSEDSDLSSIAKQDRTYPLASSETSSTDAKPEYIYNPTNGTLDLSTHNLSSLDLNTIALTPTTKITTLRLSSASLTHLPLALLTHSAIQSHLIHLDLSHNPLSATDYLMSPLHLPALTSLNIVSTGLTSLESLTTHLSAPNLRSLNISCHRLTGHVPWLRALAFPNLRELIATDNWFNSLDVEAVRGLETLDVKNNEIDSLPPKIGMLGNQVGKVEAGRLRAFEVSGNKFRVPRLGVLEKGTEAVLRDLRRMIPEKELEAEWRDKV